MLKNGVISINNRRIETGVGVLLRYTDGEVVEGCMQITENLNY